MNADQLNADQLFTSKRVLVTGSAGAVGNAVCLALVERGHFVRGADQRPTPNAETIHEIVTGDLADKETVYRAVEGVDTVIHLAAYVNNAELVETLLRPNVISPYYICEAARELGVKRLALTSSVQVIGGYGHPDQPERSIGVGEAMRPRNLYALTKAWGEIMGDMYANLYNLSVINVRIGWLPRSQEQAQAIARSQYAQNIYLSYADAQRFFIRCVESQNPAAGESIAIFAGSKAAAIPFMDLEAARIQIGYEPEDRWPENMPFTI